jgi:GntR family transcriptional regulator/MocR family aminotransferase
VAASLRRAWRETELDAVDEGLDVAARRDSGAEAVIVIPAQQFPIGVALAARRPAELIESADRSDWLIIEDDYDSELCGECIGALQGIGPGRVLYIGSASKRLTPGCGSAGCCRRPGCRGR